jgi:hypothetical protein
MPSLDGYSLNEEIKKLRKDVFEELTKQREAFTELYKFLSKMEQKKAEPKPEVKKTVSKKKTVKKEVANA